MVFVGLDWVGIHMGRLTECWNTTAIPSELAGVSGLSILLRTGPTVSG